MLAAGKAYVDQEGLSLSLEHLSMEDLIREAGVSRTSSYRRWPTKDRFAADLMLHLARSAALTDDLTGYVDAVRTLDPTLLAGLATGQGRRTLIVEAMRVITQADFEGSLASTSWRSYVVLRAAHGGLPDGDLRRQVAVALGETERGFLTSRAAALATSADLMGYRLRDPETTGWDDLAQLLSAQFTGLLIQAYSDEDAVLRTTMRRAFGSRVESPWCAATLGPAALFFGATQPDPSVVWDAARITAAERLLADFDTTLAAIWASGGLGVPDAG